MYDTLCFDKYRSFPGVNKNVTSLRVTPCVLTNTEVFQGSIKMFLPYV